MIYKPNQVVIFYSTSSPFSQFHPCKFIITEHSEYKDDEDIIFTSTEQYMHYRKAQTFGDLSMAKKIIAESDPKKIKAMGRRVKHFDEDQWNQEKLAIVRQGNIYKFSQNEKLKKVMLATGKRIFIEAAPRDKIWGVGMSARNKNIYNTDYWPQPIEKTNLLGKALESARTAIVYQERKAKAVKAKAVKAKAVKVVKAKEKDLNK